MFVSWKVKYHLIGSSDGGELSSCTRRLARLASYNAYTVHTQMHSKEISWGIVLLLLQEMKRGRHMYLCVNYVI